MEIKDTRIGLSMNKKEDRTKSNKLLVEYFFNLIDRDKPTCSIELGAFSAEFSRTIKEKNPDIKSIAFEANPYNFDFFSEKYNFKEIGIDYINRAVSDTQETISFIIQKKINNVEISPIRGNNSIMDRNNDNIEYEKVNINSIVLSDFIKENSLESEKIVLWIDVEGANEKVLKGCENIIENVNLIFIEVEEKEYWKNQWLEKNVRDFLTKNGFILVARDGEYEEQYNQIYVNKKIHSIL